VPVVARDLMNNSVHCRLGGSTPDRMACSVATIVWLVCKINASLGLWTHGFNEHVCRGMGFVCGVCTGVLVGC